MRISVLGSVSLHLFILFFTIVSLPLFNNDELEMPPVIQVELIEIAEKTHVPQISKKTEDKKPEKEKSESSFQDEFVRVFGVVSTTLTTILLVTKL